MRIQYTSKFDEQTTDYFIMINNEMDIWLVHKAYPKHFSCKYLLHGDVYWYIIEAAMFSMENVMPWFYAKSLKCYIISEKDYNILDEILTRLGNKEHIFQRIKDSLVETNTIF